MAVTISQYSESLKERFQEEKKRIASVLPKNIVIEHVGSSAVGIGGKNIVDILVGVSNRSEMIPVRDILIKNGYIEGHDTHEDRIFLASRSGETGEGDFHIHICPVQEDSFKDFIVLRDFLIVNPEKAEEYYKKKQEFAKSADFDRKKYKAIKSEYVTRLLSEAKTK